MRETETHIYFWGSIFSNWYISYFTSNKITFSSSEQYYMYQKALLFKDFKTADKILLTNDCRKQKQLGRQVKNFNNEEFDKVKFDIMFEACCFKFSQNEYIGSQLINTGDKIIVEASPTDKIWGVGLHYDDDLILDEMNWKGENLLGKVLMDIREILKIKKSD